METFNRLVSPPPPPLPPPPPPSFPPSAVLDIIYWRNWLYSAGILVAVLAFLVTLTINPFIHSLVLALLAMFFVTLTYSAGKVAWDSFHNEPLVNPFQ